MREKIYVQHTILDDTKKQCKMAYFEESTLDNKVNLGHFLNNLFQSFRIQYYKQLRVRPSVWQLSPLLAQHHY